MIITTSRSIFRPVTPGDYQMLYEIESDPGTSSTWRYKQGMPAPEEYDSLYASPESRGAGFVMEGLMAFCESVFAEWPLRWIYAHSLAQNVGAFESGIRRGDAVRLGILEKRMMIDGEPSDVHVIGISRESWMNSKLRERFNALRARAK